MRAGWWSCPHPNMSKSSWIHLHLRVKKSTLLLMATRDPANWTSWYGKNIPLSTGSYVTSQEVGRISEPSTVVNHHEAWQTDHPSNLIFWKHHGFWHHAFGTLRTSKQQYPRRFFNISPKKGTIYQRSIISTIKFHQFAGDTVERILHDLGSTKKPVKEMG